LTDEVFPQALKSESSRAFVNYTIENAKIYFLSTSILSILAMCFSLSLRVRISIVEVIIFWLFTAFSICFLVHRFFGIEMLQWKIGDKAVVFLLYPIMIFWLSVIWNRNVTHQRNRRPLLEDIMQMFLGLAIASTVALLGTSLGRSSINYRIFFFLAIIFAFLTLVIFTKVHQQIRSS